MRENRERPMKASTVPKGAKQGAEVPVIPGMEASIWTERMVSALVNGVEGGKWYSLMDKVYAPKTLALAWEKVKANRGAAGVDGQSVERFEAQAERYLTELGQALREGSYRPDAVKRVEIPKGPGQTRPLGIPTVKDRIVQTAVKLVIEPIFEVQFLATSYGFRPGRGCKDALREVDRWLKAGYTHVVDADLKAYFDSIPHDRLLARVEASISDGQVLELIRGWMKQDVLRGVERWVPTGGTPQGAVLSPLLANIYLHPLDERLMARGYRMVRYADDFVVLCAAPEEAERALQEIRDWVGDNGLMLHPDKTHIGDCRQPGEGFEFLGYRFEAGQRWVRKKSLQRFKDVIRSKTRGRVATVCGGSSPISTRRCAGGLDISSMRMSTRFNLWTDSSGDGCAHCCASRTSVPVLDGATPTINDGRMHSSRLPGCSPYTRPGKPRDTPDEETTDWRAVCGKTACTVRREGRL